MFDIVTSVKKLSINLDTVNSQIVVINQALATVSNGGGFQPTFTGPVNFDTTSGAFYFDAGTGNGASYTTYNAKIVLPTGLGLIGPSGATRGFIDANNGLIDMKGGFRVNGVNVLTASDFHPSDYATITGANFSGPVSATQLTLSGPIQATAGTLTSLSVSGALTSGSLTVTGAATISKLTLSQTLTAADANISGTVTATGAVNLNGSTRIVDSYIGTSGSGGLHLVTGSATNTGYIEFIRGSLARVGYVGNATTSGVINLSAEINGGYFNFITSNGASDPKINGNTIWHAGNFTPTTSDLSQYLQKGAAVLTGNFNASGFAILNASSFTTLAGTGSATLYSDNNVNDLVVRTGPSSGYFTTVFGADGSLQVPGALSVAGNAGVTGNTTIGGTLAVTGTVTATGALTSNATLTAGSSITTNSGVLYLGTTGSRFLNYDGNRYNLGGAELYANGYKVWHGGDFQPSSFANLGGTYHWATSSKPVLVLASSTTSIASSSANNGALMIMSEDTSSTTAYISFLNQNRWGMNLGLDGNGDLAVGGWSYGNTSYKIYHAGNLTSVVADIRLVVAGNVGSSQPDRWQEPFTGGVATGQYNFYQTTWQNGLIAGISYRYLQKQDIAGNWYTVAYVSA